MIGVRVELLGPDDDQVEWDSWSEDFGWERRVNGGEEESNRRIGRKKAVRNIVDGSIE